MGDVAGVNGELLELLVPGAGFEAVAGAEVGGAKDVDELEGGERGVRGNERADVADAGVLWADEEEIGLDGDDGTGSGAGACVEVEVELEDDVLGPMVAEGAGRAVRDFLDSVGFAGDGDGGADVEQARKSLIRGVSVKGRIWRAEEGIH